MTTSKQPATIKTPLSDGALLFRRMIARERLGRLFEYEVELLGKDFELMGKEDQKKLARIIGQTMTVSLELPGGGKRHFHGYVSRFTHAGASGRHTLFRATLRPWLWLLTRTANSRIFQGKTVPEIIKMVFRGHGLTDFDESLRGPFRAWDYRVQYRETDFNFVSRLMEQEGIYYYFKHEEKKHTLLLADSYSAHDKAKGYEKVPFYPPADRARRQRDHLDGWQMTYEMKSGKLALDDYDFERPTTDLMKGLAAPQDHDKADFRVYDYPGDFVKTEDAEAYLKVRLEELHAEYEVAEGTGDARGLGAGVLFKLTDHPEEGQNREYLIVSANYDIRLDDYESDSAAAADNLYRVIFTAIDGKRPYRSPRLTPKPAVQGPQTAIVVGKSGEDIWTDKYGRVKVQFHWDQEGKFNESSSCWVRVAHPWAGARWGVIHIPRIGQEVVISFLEGDPDRPIITGLVYNASNMPPYDLPGGKTQSGIKTRSSLGGTASNFNELRFEDKKGEEQIFVHAEKNRDIVVKNDETHTIGHDRTKAIKNDETVTVGGNRTETVDKEEDITVHGGRTEIVDKDEEITIGGNRSTQVGKDEAVTVTGARTETVGKDESVTIDGGRTLSVGKDETIEVDGKRTETVGKDESITINGKRTEIVAKDETVTITGRRAHTVQKDAVLEVGKKLLVNAGDEIMIKTGDASISMKKNGDVVIKGKNVTVSGSGKIVIDAKGEVNLKGSKITQN